MKTIFLALTVFSTSALAGEGHELFKSIGKVYELQSGPCSRYLDIMRWYDYETSGHISFALTSRPGIRPLTSYDIMATMSANHIRPLGQGEFKGHSNQPVPLKAEYVVEANKDLSLYAHHKGKGSMGGIIFDFPGYAKQNHKFEYFFSARNEAGIFEKLELTYHDLKGLTPKKKKRCQFEIAE